ncbi:uncharacterized protein DUF1992 [Scopulibacillus darangshiensis]|uniref:Uncharacterized protein DUF1992 n=1 Tax=Scopulibacillus darangshiensis TaxID=442528 RepID=A0A4R2P5C2_9BACL|nr:DUF1992 domain-containing protein [Scopulibacillus darangshiensis]TCP28975.1 uncharacterized protein DUF1992 [Scopulibacillus darangshiensis]
MDIFSTIAEGKIREAMNNGDFDHLEGQGKPLKCDDLSGVPEELRMSYKILKNSGYVPEEVKLNKEMMSLEGLIADCEDDEKKAVLQEELSEKLLKYNELMEKTKLSNSPKFPSYRKKVMKKLGL